MNTRIHPKSRVAHWTWWGFAAIVFCAAGVQPVQAQWTNANVAALWSGYNNAYLYQQNGYDDHFATTVHGSTPDTFWQSAEEIDMAIDGYVWSLTNDPGISTSIKNEVQGLCDGFVQIHGDNWSSDIWNDDLNVATMAFIRAYAITGTTRWLTDAQNNFNVVWNRAQAGDGGLCENQNGCYENSSANWTFAIDGWLIDHYNGHTGNYASDANGVYNWAVANLYIPSSGGVGDAKGYPPSYYTYNYGYAIGAASYHADSSVITGAATFLMNDFNNYAGTYNGYNILPNYGQGANDNNGGYNGIALWWTNNAYKLGFMPSMYLPWAQANMSDAWAHRNATALIWNDWVDPTPATPYSWDCSSAMTGMFDVPHP